MPVQGYLADGDQGREVLLHALRNIDQNAVVDDLRQSAKQLPKAAAEMVGRVAADLERQPDPQARDRAIKGLLQLFELRQAELSKPIIIE